MGIAAIDHVQLAMPPGQEDAARGGVWFERGAVKIHLGVDPEFRPARKAHPGLLVDDLESLITTLRTAGYDVVEGEPLAGYAHVHVDDPFGNRLELMSAREEDGGRCRT